MLCSGIELDISHWTMNRKTAAWSNLMHAKISLRSSRPSEVIVFQWNGICQNGWHPCCRRSTFFFPSKEANGRTRFLLHSPLFLAVMSPGVWKGNELNKNFGIEAATFAFFRLGSDDFLLLLSLAEKFKRYFNFLWLWQLWAESFLFFCALVWSCCWLKKLGRLSKTWEPSRGLARDWSSAWVIELPFCLRGHFARRSIARNLMEQLEGFVEFFL